MDYKVTIVSRQDRIVRIEQEKALSTNSESFIFRNKPVSLSRIRLPADLLIYRMDNGRTRLKQAEYALHHKLAPDYFLKSEEDASAQQVQHSILLDLAKDQRAPIYEELQYRATQIEPLLITSSGVVVNGNRRLAAMRHLIVNDQGDQFREYNFVDVAVLPSEATIEDIEEIESELQEIPETKLEYDWISRRLKLRYRRDVLRFVADKLLKMYRFRSKEEINRELQQLQLAEEYLERYLNKPCEYELVELSEEIFRQLQAAIEGKTPEMAEMAKLVAFPLVKEARELGSRAYEFRSAFGNDLEDVLSRLAVDKQVPVAAPVQALAEAEIEDDDEDPLAGLSEKVSDRFAALKPVLLDVKASKDIAALLVRISNGVRQEKREGGRKMMALKNAEAANRSVHEIDLNGADPQTFSQITAQLERCISQATKIRDRILEIIRDQSLRA